MKNEESGAEFIVIRVLDIAYIPRIHIMVNGGSTGAGWDCVKGVSASPYRLLSLPSEGDTYIKLTDTKTPDIEKVEGLMMSSRPLRKVKNRVEI